MPLVCRSIILRYICRRHFLPRCKAMGLVSPGKYLYAREMVANNPKFRKMKPILRGWDFFNKTLARKKRGYIHQSQIKNLTKNTIATIAPNKPKTACIMPPIVFSMMVNISGISTSSLGSSSRFINPLQTRPGLCHSLFNNANHKRRVGNSSAFSLCLCQIDNIDGYSHRNRGVFVLLR